MNPAYEPHPTLAQLQAFDAGRLPPAERGHIERHLEGCSQCSGTLDALPEGPLVALLRAFAGDTEGGSATPAEGVSDPRSPEFPAELAGHPRYRVLQVLGAGGMGVVYKAVHRLMERVVALKVIHRRLSDRPAFVERFRREVRAAARLTHPNIVTAHDADQAGATHFLVMEYVPGTTLDREVEQRGPLPVTEACELVRQAALGLQHAHERGMVHRDVKPANLLRTPGGQVKILDFGLSHLVDEASPADIALPSATVVGTPDYVAPEQARDPARADIRADVYSLGCTLYHLLAGRPPFPDGTPLQKLLAQQEGKPRALTTVRADVPEALAAVLDRMLAKDPARRYATPAGVAEALAHLADPAAPPARRRFRWRLLILAAGLLAGVGTLALVAYLVRPAESPFRPPDGTSRRGAREPALATAEELARQKGELRERALDWLRTNNRWGPDSKVVTDMAAKLDPSEGAIDAFQITLGPGVVRSRKWTILAGHAGALHTFAMTPEQTRGLTFPETSGWILTFTQCGDARRARPRVLLADVVLDGADELSFAGPITGSVGYHIRERWSGKFSLRLTYYDDKQRHMLLRNGLSLPEPNRGSLDFSFLPPSKPDAVPAGPLVVFVEVVTQEPGRMIVESSAAAAVVRVVPPKKTQP
jgi:hypothetical protein